MGAFRILAPLDGSSPPAAQMGTSAIRDGEHATMDALQNLTGNCPAWATRLDELTEHIQRRQAELAQFSNKEWRGSGTAPTQDDKSIKSMRNKGSTESLKLRSGQDSSPMLVSTPLPVMTTHSTPTPQVPRPETPEKQIEKDTQILTTSGADDSLPTPSSPGDVSVTPSILVRQTNQVMQVAQATARATLQKVTASIRRQRPSDSMISGEGQLLKYRTRSMVLVYYDSYVQSFFEELIRFASASRNLLRRARMSAKVAHMKRATELEPPKHRDPVPRDLKPRKSHTPLMLEVSAPLPGELSAMDDAVLGLEIEAEVDTQETDADEEDFQPVYVSARRMGPVSRGVSAPQCGPPTAFPRASHMATGRRDDHSSPPDEDSGPMFDELDKRLEAVQALCEHAAHQFLRDGRCGEEVQDILKKLVETQQLADQEMIKIPKTKSIPTAPEIVQESPLPRSYHPSSMRRLSDDKDDTPRATPRSTPFGTPKVKIPDHIFATSEALEVDEGIDADGDDELPPLVYKSARSTARMRLADT